MFKRIFDLVMRGETPFKRSLRDVCSVGSPLGGQSTVSLRDIPHRLIPCATLPENHTLRHLPRPRLGS